LADLYQQMHFDDLSVHHARQYLDLKKESGPEPGQTAEQFEREATALEKRIVEKENEIKRLQDQFELRAAGKSVLDRAQVALEYGLGQTALDVLEKAKQTELVDEHSTYYAQGVAQELMLWLQTGQVEKAAEVLDGEDNQKKLPGVLGVLPDVGLPGYDWLKTLLAAAKGDYAEADRRLASIQTQLARSDHFPTLLREMEVADDPDATKGLDVSAFTALVAGHLVLREAPRATGAAWLTLQDVPLEIPAPRPPPPTLLVPRTREVLLDFTANGTLSVVRRQADLDALRGWLLLEGGATPAARDAFDQALSRSLPPDRWTPGLVPLAATQPFEAAAFHAVADRSATAVGVQFGGRPIALMGLKWVEGK
jgi:predicted negative regulator of RcsB-dependent stress response